MKIGAGILVAVLAGLPLAAAEVPGTEPLRRAADYGAAAGRDGVEIGARLLSSGEVRRMGLGSGWVVAEVGVFPGAGELRVDAADFVLRTDDGRLAVLPGSAEAVARLLSSPPSPATGPASVAFASERDGGVLITTVHESPATPTNGAGRTPLPSPVTGPALPEGLTARPKAGYLYFAPALGPLDGATVELEYLGATRPIRLMLSRPVD